MHLPGYGRTVVLTWPQIKVIPSELPRIVNEAEDALMLLGQEFYQRGGMLAWSGHRNHREQGRQDGGLATDSRSRALIRSIRSCCAAQFAQVDGRGKTKAWKPIDAPDKAASALFPAAVNGSCRSLTASCRRCSYAADGSLCETPGYDRRASCCSRRMVRFR